MVNYKPAALQAGFGEAAKEAGFDDVNALFALSYVVSGFFMRENVDSEEEDIFEDGNMEFPPPPYMYRTYPVSIWNDGYYSHNFETAPIDTVLLLEGGSAYGIDELVEILGITRENCHVIGNFCHDLYCNILAGDLAFEGKMSDSYRQTHLKLPPEFPHLFKYEKYPPWTRNSLSKRPIPPGTRMMNLLLAWPQSRNKSKLESIATTIIPNGDSFLRDPSNQRRNLQEMLDNISSEFKTSLKLPDFYSNCLSLDENPNYLLDKEVDQRTLQRTLGLIGAAGVPLEILEHITVGLKRKVNRNYEHPEDDMGKLIGWLEHSSRGTGAKRGQLVGTSSFRLPMVSAANLARLRESIGGRTEEKNDNVKAHVLEDGSIVEKIISFPNDATYIGTVFDGEGDMAPVARNAMESRRERRRRQLTERMQENSILRTTTVELGDKRISLNALISKLSAMRDERDVHIFLRAKHSSMSELFSAVQSRNTPLEAKKQLRDSLNPRVYNAVFNLEEPQARAPPPPRDNEIFPPLPQESPEYIPLPPEEEYPQERYNRYFPEDY